MIVGEILLESSQQKYRSIVEPVPKKFRFNPHGRPMVELDVPRRTNSARKLSELQHVAQLCNLLAPDYVIYLEANSRMQDYSLFDDPHHLPAQGDVQFKQRLCILLAHATLDRSPQSAANLQGNSSL